ncbi:hypothetical protein AAOE16_18275 [Ekhidna sp. MALMAid0563]|uniref:hypothetical protein n=1 Tax=Ekhidna sp. MALMAid0563 TaxID=3143937 RepID=UPI0032DE6A69
MKKQSEIIEAKLKDLHSEAASIAKDYLSVLDGMKNVKGLKFRDPDSDLEESLHSSYEVEEILSDGTIKGKFYHGESCEFDIDTLLIEELVYFLDVLECLTVEYFILSPDKFPTFPEPFKCTLGNFNEHFKLHFSEWKKSFEKQGYYSSNHGRITLNELESACDIKIVSE